jgi:hypothetical protein
MIFVQIVAKMQDKVEIVCGVRMGIGVEPAKGQVGAGKHGHAVALDVADRQGAGAAYGGFGAVRGNDCSWCPASNHSRQFWRYGLAAKRRWLARP